MPVAQQIITKTATSLPDATTFARCITKLWTKRRTDRITNGENFIVQITRAYTLKKFKEKDEKYWRLTCYKRIIRENDAKKLETYSLQKNNQRKSCKRDFLT